MDLFFEKEMVKAADLKDMDVDELLALRADVESALKERMRDLERQIALLGDGAGHGKRHGRSAGGGVRASALKGRTVPPKYRGPNGETWAGRGAMPRWLSGLIKEGHSVEEFLIGAGRKGRATAAKTVKKQQAGTRRTLRKRRDGGKVTMSKGAA
ncbi:MAG: H-NS histone family protein [Burkholderiales bacterium]